MEAILMIWALSNPSSVQTYAVETLPKCEEILYREIIKTAKFSLDENNKPVLEEVTVHGVCFQANVKES